MISRRKLLISASASSVAIGASAVHTPSFAQDKVIRVGTLKLMHAITPHFYEKFAPAGYKFEVIAFETPTDGKNAVVTKSVDFGVFGIAAATLGAAAGEPVVVVGAQCNKGMAVVAGKDSGITSIKGLKNKKVGILPGSTQEVVIYDRLKQEGMTAKDILPVRLAFSEMANALERGDIDAYVGAEPGPSISMSRGIGKIIEYPYSTPTGTLNMVTCTHADIAKSDPAMVKIFMQVHRKATEYAVANRAAFIEMCEKKLGLPAKTAELAAPNIELTWRIDDEWITRAKYYGSQMFDKKQIRQLPDYASFINPSFSKVL